MNDNKPAILCGIDPYSGQNYDHRRQWIHDLLEQLAGLFCIEVAFHAEMSNHLHVVLRTRPDVAQRWSREEVVRRWLKIAKIKRGTGDARWEPTTDRIQQELADPKRVNRLRKRLSDISWFMAAVCENVARRANQEEHLRGRFWETRFCSRNLADETAILVCGMYVDLNPIRAGEATTPEESRYTSAYDRICGLQASRIHTATDKVTSPDRWLCELTLSERLETDVGTTEQDPTPHRASDKGLLSMSREAYLALLDWTGRQVRSDKRGAIPDHLAPILERLQIRSEHWLETVLQFDQRFGCVVGRAEEITTAAARMGRRWLRGRRVACELFV